VEAVAVPLPASGWAQVAATAAADRCQAIVVGPGLGRASAAEVRDLLLVDQPVVVDGDGLAALAPHGARLGSRSGVRLLEHRAAPTVITPHDGEHELITGHRPGADRLAAARDLAAVSGSVVLLKGPTTIVADPSGHVRMVTSGDARLATAGTGDVLSGIIGALIAQGVPAFDAAAAGAWLHGRAASLGPESGFVASDLVELLPVVLDVLHDEDD
jgi:NAD(P)H-hydrate epimerase